MSWCRGPEKREHREGQDEGPQTRVASYTASCRDSFSKVNSSSTAPGSPSAATTASAAADQKPVPATAAAAAASGAAPAPPIPPSGNAHASPARDPKDDDDPATRDSSAAQEHTHQPALQRDGGHACSSALATSSEPAETCCGTPEIPRPTRISTAYTWTCSQQFQPAPTTPSPGPVESPTTASGARPFLLRSFW